MTHLPPSAIQELGARMHGDIILPGDARYDEARAVWNGLIDRRPAAILRPIDAAGVAAAVCFARDRDLLLAVRGGGHNSAGTGVCDGGVVIDLVRDAARRRSTRRRERCTRRAARCSPTWIGETSRFGLAVPAGIVSHTGVGGLTLGGGFGWISRKHGFSVDNLLSAQVVTADGHVVRASASRARRSVLGSSRRRRQLRRRHRVRVQGRADRHRGLFRLDREARRGHAALHGLSARLRRGVCPTT